uniref:StAR related lipid transfer domain containing 6 n=1 Tax=Cavia porcellus TaxID=10141 RepID=A0A286XSB4_CAVPO
MDYKTIAQQTSQEVFGYNQDTSGWKVVKNSSTFICHTITQSFAMGSISPRDFIDVVCFKCYEGNMAIISSKSVDFPGYPPTSEYIRGYNYPCGFVCSP